MLEILKAFVKSKRRLSDIIYGDGDDQLESIAIEKTCDSVLFFIEELQRMTCAGCGEPLDSPSVEEAQPQGKYSEEVLERILPTLNEACDDGRIVVFDRTARSLYNAICASNNNGAIQYDIQSKEG